jgi:hypothetical protein
VKKKCVPDLKYEFSPENLSPALVSSGGGLNGANYGVQTLLDTNAGCVFDLASWVTSEKKLGHV